MPDNVDGYTPRTIFEHWPPWVDYTMHFTRYNTPETHQVDSLITVIQLMDWLEDCHSEDFDQWGILDEVECAGHATIPSEELDKILAVYQSDREGFRAVADMQPEGHP